MCFGPAAALLQSLAEPAKENMDVELRIHAKQKGQDGSEQIGELLNGLRDSENDRLGVIAKASGLFSCVTFPDKQFGEDTGSKGFDNNNPKRLVGRKQVREPPCGLRDSGEVELAVIGVARSGAWRTTQGWGRRF